MITSGLSLIRLLIASIRWTSIWLCRVFAWSSKVTTTATMLPIVIISWAIITHVWISFMSDGTERRRLIWLFSGNIGKKIGKRFGLIRSEERRVGKECVSTVRSGRPADQ